MPSHLNGFQAESYSWMGRNKLDMNKKIADPRRREMSWAKRKLGAYKKAQQLKTLCDLEAAYVIFIKPGKRWEYSSTGLPFQPPAGRPYPDDLRGPEDLERQRRKWNCSDAGRATFSPVALCHLGLTIPPLSILPNLRRLPFNDDLIARLTNEYNGCLRALCFSSGHL